MTLRILVDDTVVIDYVGERQPYCACWDKMSALQLTGCAELWSTPDAYRAMSESLRGVLPDDVADDALAATLDFVEVCPVDGRDVLYALEQGVRYDDALIDRSARKMRADYVVSRRALEGIDAKAVACTPEGLFEHLEQTRGLAFDLVDI